jgi:ferrous iron transport protein B
MQLSDLTTSVIGHIGRFIEPVLRPLGFNWKIGIGLLSSIVAREVIVGTLGTLYGVDPATHSLGLQAALRHDMTLGGAIALVVFFAFAMQCTSTLAVVRRETNSWKFPRAAVRLHDRGRLRRRPHHQPGHRAPVLASRQLVAIYYVLVG